MDLIWTSLDQFWRSPTFPIWLTLAAAAFFAILFLVVVLRADRSIANAALTVLTLLAVAVATAATVRGFGGGLGGGGEPARSRAAVASGVSLPALACVDDLAGDGVEAACEKVLFGSPDHVAAAVSYAAARLDRLTALGDVAAAGGALTPDLQALRRAIERDRYGLTAHVLVARDGCTAAMCPAYRSLTDQRQIAANIEGRVYDGLVTRYAPAWGGASIPAADTAAATPTIPAAAAPAALAEPPSVPTGKPTTADFPSAASIPPVSIMTPEPAANPAPAPAPTAAPKAKAAPKAAAKAAPPAHAPTSSPAASRRPTHPPAPPVQLAPPRGDN
ncbi:MAG: hypothetical protein M9932_11850 [Xanthobacteraceae bacterium]|nr:hypothetical protein [Xanthobacteraceae bacterium]